MLKLNIALFVIGAASLPIITQNPAPAETASHGDAFVQHALAPHTLALQSPRESWAPQDPADAIWRQGRNAINESNWAGAADLFRRIRTESGFSRSVYRGQSHYWEAYARTQMGGSAQLRQARTLLSTLMEDFPEDARNIRDAAALLATVEGRLSREFGDQDAAARLRANAGTAANGCPDIDDDDNPKAAALNALVQMNTEVAMPILEKILANLETCAGPLRARAIWLVAQQQSPRAVDILLQAAKTDPDLEVREQAVFWLSQVDSEKAIDALEAILRTPWDAVPQGLTFRAGGRQDGDCRVGNGCIRESLHENALFALSQNTSPRASAVLRSYATRSDVPADLRSNAIFWLSQNGDPTNLQFLIDLYGKVPDTESREQLLNSIAQIQSDASAQWLLRLAVDEKQDIELRKQALFWYGQGGEPREGGRDPRGSSSELIRLYDRMTDTEMKEQLIFVFAQNGKDTAFVNKLMDIAKNDRSAELRTRAIFWLGQAGSNDPRVAKFLADIING